jgi:hypothetical protein
MSVNEARRVLQRARDESWAWIALHRCLRAVIEATLRGERL